MSNSPSSHLTTKQIDALQKLGIIGKFRQHWSKRSTMFTIECELTGKLEKFDFHREDYESMSDMRDHAYDVFRVQFWDRIPAHYYRFATRLLTEIAEGHLKQISFKAITLPGPDQVSYRMSFKYEGITFSILADGSSFYEIRYALWEKANRCIDQLIKSGVCQLVSQILAKDPCFEESHLGYTTPPVFLTVVSYRREGASFRDWLQEPVDSQDVMDYMVDFMRGSQLMSEIEAMESAPEVEKSEIKKEPVPEIKKEHVPEVKKEPVPEIKKASTFDPNPIMITLQFKTPARQNPRIYIHLDPDAQAGIYAITGPLPKTMVPVYHHHGFWQLEGIEGLPAELLIPFPDSWLDIAYQFGEVEKKNRSFIFVLNDHEILTNYRDPFWGFHTMAAKKMLERTCFIIDCATQFE